MSKKREGYYYKTLAEGTVYSGRAAELLCKTLRNYEVETLRERLDEMHEIEHAADLIQHGMMRQLVREFITPIEREDIIELAQAIDDVTDSIEDVLLRAYMFNITSIRREALDFCEVIMSCCAAMQKMMEEFHNFSKSTVIHKMIVDINRLEEDGDTLYTDAMRRLHVHSKDPIELVSWTEMFNRLEKCCDECEDVANVVETVILKNS